MSLQRMTRITCDTCGDFRTVTGDNSEAERLVTKAGWTVHPWDSYGNVGHFCNSECLAAKMRQIKSEDKGAS